MMSRVFKCPTCNGAKLVSVLQEHVDLESIEGHVPEPETEVCPDCEGTGRDLTAALKDRKSNNRRGAFNDF